jgi:hypothetical protein
MNKAQHVKRRMTQMVAARQLHEQVWKDCYDMTYPERAHGLQSQIIGATDSQSRKAIIYDSTARDSCRVGSASLMGAMVPSNAQWFGLDIGESSTDEEKRFIDDVARFMWENLHSSNFDAEAFDALIDNMASGWFVLYEDEAEGGGYHFELWALGECYIASTSNAKRIDTVYRKFSLSVSQLVAEYGEDKVSQKVRDMYAAGKLDEKVEILHCIEPRGGYDSSKSDKLNLPFQSLHIESNGDHLLREGGYHEFPCMVPRWARLPGSAYATGPMSDALADVRTLNQVAYLTLLGAETTITPMLKVVDDGVTNIRNIRMGPRKLLPVADINSIEPLNTGAKLEFGEMKAERLQGSIRKMLLADQLPPADGPVKTAYEWSIRVETMRKILGPMFSRFQSEFLQPLIERTFGITWRANNLSGFALIGKPPESLVNRNFTVRYLSPLARSQRLEDVSAMDRYEQALGLAAQVDPSILDVYDGEGAMRERADLLGIKTKLIRDERKVTDIREARAKAQADAQQQAVAAEGQMGMQDAMAQRVANAA